MKSLRLALIDSDAKVDRQCFTVFLTTTRGQTVRGVALSEDDLSIQIRDSDRNLRSFLKDDLKSVRREPRSLMPSYAVRLSAAEIDDLISYLRTLPGPTPKIGPRTRQPHHAYSSIAFLDRIGRDAEERPDTLINALEITAGATVAELRSGRGYYTWRLARTVGPSGKVFAVDYNKVCSIAPRKPFGSINSIMSNWCWVRKPTPSPRGERWIWCFWHMPITSFQNPEAILAAMNPSLRPGGRLAAVEFAEGHSFGPKDKAERMTDGQIRAEIEPAGFNLDRVLEFVRIEHCLVFTKREAN